MIIGTYIHSIGGEGARSGNATVVAVKEKEYTLLCDCGSYFSVKHSTRLKNDGEFSCRQCYVKRDSSRASAEWYFPLIKKRIMTDAKKAGRNYELSDKFLAKILESPCYYCGTFKSNTITYKSNSGTFRRSYQYNGIDRVDNSLGYLESNCVPCCKICNRAKGNLSQEEFLSWAARLAKE